MAVGDARLETARDKRQADSCEEVDANAAHSSYRSTYTTWIFNEGRCVKTCTIETLESRCLLSAAFVAHINFQTPSFAVPAGYVPDTGGVYGLHPTSLLTYGWNAPKPAQVISRKVKKQPINTDSRYDSLAVMHAKGRGSLWEINVPSPGTYDVTVTAGDYLQAGGRQRILVDGTYIVNGRATAKSKWITGTQQVFVTDGLLKLTVPKGATSKIDFIDVQQVLPVGGSVPVPPGALVIPQTQSQNVYITRNLAGGVETIINGAQTDYAEGQWSAVAYTGTANVSSINIDATVVPTIISAASSASITIGDVAMSAGLQQISSPLSITMTTPGLTTIDDAGDTTGHTINLTGSSTAGQAILSGIAPANITFSAGQTTVDTGGGSDTVNIAVSGVNFTNTGGNDAYTFTNSAGSIIDATAGSNTIVVDTTSEAAGETLAMATSAAPGASIAPFQSITQQLRDSYPTLTAAPTIQYNRALTTSVTIKTDTAAKFGNSLSIDNASPVLTPLSITYQGGGNDSVEIDGTEAGTPINVTANSLNVTAPMTLGVDGAIQFHGVASSAFNPTLSLTTNTLTQLTMSKGKFVQGTSSLTYSNTPTVILSSVGVLGGQPTMLDYSSGDPLPTILDLAGSFTLYNFPISGDPLAGHRIDVGTAILAFAFNPSQDKTLQNLIRHYIANAYVGGVWNLTGFDMITSSYTAVNTDRGLAYVDSADGVDPSQQGSTILVKVAKWGDYNLDDVVDSTDLAVLESNLNKPGDYTWDQGDFNYDGTVNSADQALLDENLT